uniref:S100P-binding protein n=1 Tax=Sinocyclocheilus rhinocerous TaxID=307959 RepID=A0A673JMB3_9TELE
MSDDDSSFHLKPLSVYSHMVCSKQQYNANSPVYNIQVHISNKEAGARKKEGWMIHRQCLTRTFSPDQGYFSMYFLTRVQGLTPTQPLIISKDITPPRSKVNQSVTPVVSTPLSSCKQNWIDQDRESLPPRYWFLNGTERFLQLKYHCVHNTKTTSKPVVFCEEEWERRKKTYVESVKRHMKEKGAANGVITELHTLMNTVASHQTGGNGPHWQHPSDLTRSPESRHREPDQTNETKYFLCHLFIEKKDPLLHICAVQK